MPDSITPLDFFAANAVAAIIAANYQAKRFETITKADAQACYSNWASEAYDVARHMMINKELEDTNNEGY